MTLPPDFVQTIETLRSLLQKAVKRDMAEGILLSGGLDTSIVATLASKYADLKAYTCALKNAPAPDLEYAKLMASRLKLKHLIHEFDYQELEQSLRHVVQTLKTFDPMEVRNSATVLTTLKIAHEDGVNSVFTGDGCDELFAGYSFMFKLDPVRLSEALERMWRVMSFSSVPLASSLGMEAKLPYLDPDFKNYAMSLDVKYLASQEKGQLYGKWIVRKAFEDLMPAEVTWRIKTPIEYGSGTTTLPELYRSWISDMEFEEEKNLYMNSDAVNIRDKEHLAYYRVYRQLFGPPRPAPPESRKCPQCQSALPQRTNFCRTCGAYPV